MTTRRDRRVSIGDWYVERFRARRRVVGVAAVARQLKKQGVALRVALLILGIAPTRPPDAPAVLRGAPRRSPRGRG
jgi:hypothetical protein